MKEVDLVSVIIPVFNGERFIRNTIDAVLSQSYSKIEIIIVNDGSVDNTLSIIESVNDDSITGINQSNTGVSVARNNGFKISNGEYICFLDADDLIPVSFIEDRVNFLKKNTQFNFCCSDYIIIDEDKNVIEEDGFVSLTTDGIAEILLYKPNACSTPSSFMFSFDFLNNNKILFHPLLSNTADKLFILDCFKFGNGAYFKGSPFFHIVYSGSMSSIISKKILLDFKLYVSLLINRNYIPKDIKRKCLKLNYRILCGITRRTGNYVDSAKYFLMYIFK
jgi:glycosyltransferase involved in cell wall biosynthesis